MLSSKVLRRMPKEDKALIRDGAVYLGLFLGGFSYFNYREYIKKDFYRSEGHYRFNTRITNITPWRTLYFTWWRMPDEEYNAYHRFRPYYIVGQVDYSKEILIPATKTVDGVQFQGYDVINPVYCYEGGKMSFQKLFESQDPVSVERAALIVNRGWIPAELKDKRSRPNEINSRRLVRINGIFLKGKNLHDYKIPNNPDNNEWHNMALEDIGIYWDLPNFDEIKHYYFQAVDFGQSDGQGDENQFPIPQSKDEVIDNFYKWKITARTHQNLFRATGFLSSVSFLLAFLAL